MSTVTEILMGCGGFDITLDQTAPRSIVEGLPTWSTICVTPGRSYGMTREDVLAVARFSGVLRSRTNNLCTLRGPSIISVMGDEDGKGPHVTESVTGISGAPAMFTDLFDPASNVNGLTLGSTTGLPGTAIYLALNTPDPETPRDFMDRACRALDWQYRCSPDGVVDIEPKGDLFVSDPRVLVVPDWMGEPISEVITLAVAGKIRATASDDDYTTEVTVTDGTYSGSASVLGTPPNDFTTAASASIWKEVTGSGYASNSDATTQAGYEILNNYATKNLISVSIKLEDPRARIEPGDSIYVYDPIQGLVDTTNQVISMGRELFPVTVEVQEMAWPVTEGMGVYAILNTTGAVWDLSEYVVWGTGDTSLKVGAKWPTLAEVVNGRN